MKKILLSVFLFVSAIVAAQPPKILEEFRFFNYDLGNPRPESPLPKQCAAPKNFGWWQAFEKGWIYYTPGLRGVVVKEPFYSEWSRLGREQGILGFPMFTESMIANQHQQSIGSQTFEGGTISFNHVTRQTSIEYNPNLVSPGKYRLVLCGIRVETETTDNALQTDGKGDDIYIRTDAFIRDENGVVTKMPVLKTKVLGDTNGQENRIRAGSRGNEGGLMTNDMFPLPRPWEITAVPPADPYSANNLPMKIWEGDITYGSYLVVIPSIWEWDDYKPSHFENNWTTMINDVVTYGPRRYEQRTIGRNQNVGIDQATGNLPIGMYLINVSGRQQVNVHMPVVVACRQGFYFGSEYEFGGQSTNYSPQGGGIFEAFFQNDIAPHGKYRMYLKWEKLYEKKK